MQLLPSNRAFLITAAFVSTLGVIGWMITDFYGGMIIYLLMYSWVIFPMLIIYVVTAIVTLLKIITNGIRANKILCFIHGIGIFTIVLFWVYQSELFKSRIILQATLVDDLSSINLVLRENGHFETTTDNMFGYSHKIIGRYKRRNDTLIFLSKPYSNDFIPNTVIIDRKDSAIYFKRTPDGYFIRKKSFCGYFGIKTNKL